MLLGDLSERGQRHDAGVGKQDVKAALLPLDAGEQPVEVREVRDVALHAGDVLADLPDRFVKLRLSAAGDEDVGAFRDEPVGGGQADAAVASGDDGDFPFHVPTHGTPPLPVRAAGRTSAEGDRPPRGVQPDARKGCSKPTQAREMSSRASTTSSRPISPAGLSWRTKPSSRPANTPTKSISPLAASLG